MARGNRKLISGIIPETGKAPAASPCPALLPLRIPPFALALAAILLAVAPAGAQPAAGTTENASSGASPRGTSGGTPATQESQTPANRSATPPGATPKSGPDAASGKQGNQPEAAVPANPGQKPATAPDEAEARKPAEAGKDATPPARATAAPKRPASTSTGLTPSDGTSGIELPFFAGGRKAPPPPPKKDWRHTKREPDLAFAAFQRGLFVTAFRLATERVSKNPDDAAAMTLLGEIYKDGLGIRESKADAIRWYRLAAARGDREAAFALGRAYLEGEGVEKDEARARQFLRQAADKGHGKAQYNLGMMALKKEKRDFDAAARRFRQAIGNGDLDAMYALAQLHRHGHGVPKDRKRETALLKQAAEGRHLAAETEYAIALFNGTGTGKDEKAAAKWFQKAAWRNSPVAQNRLARLYAAGRGVRRDMVKAMTWHIIARSNGLPDKWLESRLPLLTRTQRELVNQAVRKFAGK